MFYLKVDLILNLCIASVFSKRHVIKSTRALRQQGYHGDIDLGEVIAEVMVDSPEACGRLCEQNPVCHSVMVMGQMCRMFSTSHCPVKLDEVCNINIQTNERLSSHHKLKVPDGSVIRTCLMGHQVVCS